MEKRRRSGERKTRRPAGRRRDEKLRVSASRKKVDGRTEAMIAASAISS